MLYLVRQIFAKVPHPGGLRCALTASHVSQDIWDPPTALFCSSTQRVNHRPHHLLRFQTNQPPVIVFEDSFSSCDKISRPNRTRWGSPSSRGVPSLRANTVYYILVIRASVLAAVDCSPPS
ncbi:PREDICTED: uncharacterized protein LOC108578080 [Habropoda laboriosa]|uniref:uncharacterized protein LOC108578080 n=1 Tax=Habropoda laboriosa TaxID=597456 RepID=UPI00083CAFFC|nr:PREDICTED: uncharacterized protein LOC108578080 [Habropoda laboriosa]